MSINDSTVSRFPLKHEFLELTQLGGEPIFLDPSQIGTIKQLEASDTFPGRTVVTINNNSFIVLEDAQQIALASGRGYYDCKEK
jgi:uncharacterized protein YlzI (FlbEa/FlbD family)